MGGVGSGASWMKGKRRSKEDCLAISVGTKKAMKRWRRKLGKRVYEELQKRIGKKVSKSLKGRNIYWMRGKTYEEIYGPERAAELRLARLQALTGLKRSKETRAKLVVARSVRVIPFVILSQKRRLLRF